MQASNSGWRFDAVVAFGSHPPARLIPPASSRYRLVSAARCVSFPAHLPCVVVSPHLIYAALVEAFLPQGQILIESEIVMKKV